jgi:hypothetical protein
MIFGLRSRGNTAILKLIKFVNVLLVFLFKDEKKEDRRKNPAVFSS